MRALFLYMNKVVFNLSGTLTEVTGGIDTLLDEIPYIESETSIKLFEYPGLEGPVSGKLLWRRGNSFYVLTGCVKSVMSNVAKRNLETTINKYYPAKHLYSPILTPILREHQALAVTKSMEMVRGVISSPTGSGKSFIIAELCHWISLEGPVLVTVPTRTLLYQMKKDVEDYYERVERPCPDIGLIGDGNLETDKLVTIAIPDTLSSREEQLKSWFSSIYGLIGDECHTTANPTYWSFVRHMNARRFSLGLSATPWTNNGLQYLLNGVFGPTILEIKESEMIEKGVIMKPLFKFYYAPGSYASPKLLGATYSHWVYNKLYDALIVNNKGRNNLIVDLAIEAIEKRDGPVVILVNKVGTSTNKKTGKPSLSHASILKDLFLERGIDLPIVHGGTHSKEQDLRLNQVSNYEIPGIIAGPKLLSAGVSIHSIVYIILAGAGRVDSMLIQRVGRALRTKEGKARPTIIDFIDPISYFASQSNTRMEIVEKVYPGCTEINKKV